MLFRSINGSLATKLSNIVPKPTAATPAYASQQSRTTHAPLQAMGVSNDSNQLGPHAAQQKPAWVNKNTTIANSAATQAILNLQRNTDLIAKMLLWFQSCKWYEGPPLQVTQKLTYRTLVLIDAHQPVYAYNKTIDKPCPICNEEHIGLTLFLIIHELKEPIVHAPNIVSTWSTPSQQIYHPDTYIICPNATLTDSEPNPSLSYDPNFPRAYPVPGLPSYDPSRYDFSVTNEQDQGILPPAQYNAAFWSANLYRPRYDMPLRGMMPLQEDIRIQLNKNSRTNGNNRRRHDKSSGKFPSNDYRNVANATAGAPNGSAGFHGTIQMLEGQQIPPEVPNALYNAFNSAGSNIFKTRVRIYPCSDNSAFPNWYHRCSFLLDTCATANLISVTSFGDFAKLIMDGFDTDLQDCLDEHVWHASSPVDPNVDVPCRLVTLHVALHNQPAEHGVSLLFHVVRDCINTIAMKGPLSAKIFQQKACELACGSECRLIPSYGRPFLASELSPAREAIRSSAKLRLDDKFRDSHTSIFYPVPILLTHDSFNEEESVFEAEFDTGSCISTSPSLEALRVSLPSERIYKFFTPIKFHLGLPTQIITATHLVLMSCRHVCTSEESPDSKTVGFWICPDIPQIKLAGNYDSTGALLQMLTTPNIVAHHSCKSKPKLLQGFVPKMVSSTSVSSSMNNIIDRGSGKRAIQITKTFVAESSAAILAKAETTSSKKPPGKKKKPLQLSMSPPGTAVDLYVVDSDDMPPHLTTILSPVVIPSPLRDGCFPGYTSLQGFSNVIDTSGIHDLQHICTSKFSYGC